MSPRTDWGVLASDQCLFPMIQPGAVGKCAGRYLRTSRDLPTPTRPHCVLAYSASTKTNAESGAAPPWRREDCARNYQFAVSRLIDEPEESSHGEFYLPMDIARPGTSAGAWGPFGLHTVARGCGFVFIRLAVLRLLVAS